MTRRLALPALAGALAGLLAAAPIPGPALAQSMPPPPSMRDPAPEAKPARKPAKPRPKAEAAGVAKPAAKAQSYTEGQSAPRKINPRDIDDPYGGVGPSERAAPTFTPSGKVGVGGRF
jgi:hypothetical protein